MTRLKIRLLEVSVSTAAALSKSRQKNDASNEKEYPAEYPDNIPGTEASEDKEQRGDDE